MVRKVPHSFNRGICTPSWTSISPEDLEVRGHRFLLQDLLAGSLTREDSMDFMPGQNTATVKRVSAGDMTYKNQTQTGAVAHCKLSTKEADRRINKSAHPVFRPARAISCLCKNNTPG